MSSHSYLPKHIPENPPEQALIVETAINNAVCLEHTYYADALLLVYSESTEKGLGIEDRVFLAVAIKLLESIQKSFRTCSPSSLESKDTTTTIQRLYQVPTSSYGGAL